MGAFPRSRAQSHFHFSRSSVAGRWGKKLITASAWQISNIQCRGMSSPEMRLNHLFSAVKEQNVATSAGKVEGRVVAVVGWVLGDEGGLLQHSQGDLIPGKQHWSKCRTTSTWEDPDRKTVEDNHLHIAGAGVRAHACQVRAHACCQAVGCVRGHQRTGSHSWFNAQLFSLPWGMGFWTSTCVSVCFLSHSVSKIAPLSLGKKKKIGRIFFFF